jgi:hypothetical protein
MDWHIYVNPFFFHVIILLYFNHLSYYYMYIKKTGFHVLKSH